jgi:hypothetical protein
MQRLSFVRNRAAHPEPIHQRNLTRDVDDAVTLMSWVSLTPPDGCPPTVLM